MALSPSLGAVTRSGSPFPQFQGARSMTPSRLTHSRPQGLAERRSASSVRDRVVCQAARPSSSPAPSTRETDCFATLGLQASASAAEIRQAYRSLAKQCHPDVNSEGAAVTQFVTLRSAYEMCLLSEADRSQGVPSLALGRSEPSRRASSGTGSELRKAVRRTQTRRDAWDDIWDEMLSSPKGRPVRRRR